MGSSVRVAGTWSFYGSYLLVLGAAIYLNGFSPLKEGLVQFFCGNYEELALKESSYQNALPLGLAVVALAIPICVSVALLAHEIKKGVPIYSYHKVCLSNEGESLLRSFLFLIFLEELIARWFFLGILHKYLQGATWFYILFFLGNGIWAYIHLANFEEEEEGKPIFWILPQFLMGIPLTIVFMKYGLIATVLVHFAYNTVLWSKFKIQSLDGYDFYSVCVSAGIAGGSYYLMQHPLSDIAIWYSNDAVFEIPNWQIFDYVLLAVFTYNIVQLGLDILLYDHRGAKLDNLDDLIEKLDTPVARLVGISITCLMIFISCLVIVPFANLQFYLASYLTSSSTTAILAYSLIGTILVKDTSISAMSRSFWTAMSVTGIVICCIQALSYWNAVCFLTALCLLNIPTFIIRHYAKMN